MSTSDSGYSWAFSPVVRKEQLVDPKGLPGQSELSCMHEDNCFLGETNKYLCTNDVLMNAGTGMILCLNAPRLGIEVPQEFTCTAGGSSGGEDWTGMCLLYVQDANEASGLECIASWLGGVIGLVMR